MRKLYACDRNRNSVNTAATLGRAACTAPTPPPAAAAIPAAPAARNHSRLVHLKLDWFIAALLKRKLSRVSRPDCPVSRIQPWTQIHIGHPKSRLRVTDGTSPRPPSP